ncbi:AsnC family protein [Microbacterium sp. Marseille-Q6965]|uniref:AsnC family protein n=1 Tax=Microbacterium sp. Marseille-Q6965 TaxID=2965072 RepID=UPI0021B7FF9E|nr:AsnC family protein [Microbacterium sp. Marseille-Q6965]
MVATATSEQGPEQPLSALRRLAERRRELSREEEALVRRARVLGYSWEAIAMALGVSKQAAHKKFGRK